MVACPCARGRPRKLPENRSGPPQFPRSAPPRRSNTTQLAMPLYSGPITDHFNGEHFYNPREAAMHGGGSLLKWLVTRTPKKWRKWIDAAPGAAPPERVSDGNIRATFVGH